MTCDCIDVALSLVGGFLNGWIWRGAWMAWKRAPAAPGEGT